MDAQRQNIKIFFSVWIALIWTMFLILSAQSTAIAQKTLADDALSLHHRPVPLFQFLGYTPSREPQAIQLARARWKFLNRCSLMLYSDTYGDTRVIFPLGRADRMYFLIRGDDGPAIECYQHKNGKVKRVYHVNLEVKTRPGSNEQPAQVRPLYTNILDDILQEWSESFGGPEVTMSYVLAPAASQYARKDLALSRDFVEYSQNDFGEYLLVSVYADIKNGEGIAAEYNLDLDPFTKAPLIGSRSDENIGFQFYKKYGLPVTKEELLKAGLIHGRTKTKH